MAPRTKAQPRHDERPVLGDPELARMALEDDPADGEEVLRWLETGEGDPWRGSSD